MASSDYIAHRLPDGPWDDGKVPYDANGNRLPRAFQHEGPPADGKKASNPKDIIGAGKAPLELVPDTLRVAASMAFLEGALKYGRFNWRLAGVRASIYKAALDRHMASWWNGEDIDAQSGLPHLWKAAACIAILIDSKEAGKLTDDRPPALDLTAMIDGLERDIARLKALHADKSPHQCTIADGTPLAVPPSVAPGCGRDAPARHIDEQIDED